MPDRIVAIEDRALRSYDGGWADLTRERAAPEEVAQQVTEPTRPAHPRPERTAPSELEVVETSIALVEARISELEGKLAGDWSDMDVLTAHRAARDELKELLGRWEVLFEDSGAK